MRRISLVFLATALAPHALPQTFDVASVKRLSMDPFPQGGLKRSITATSVSFHVATLGNLFEWAFGMTIYQVIGPNWLNWPTDAAYDIDAKTGSPATEEQLKQMMQTLMVERFQLKFHRETRDTVVYALVVAKSGPKLQRSESVGEARVRPTGMYKDAFDKMSMAEFALFLETPFQPRHVVDETGLTGKFDFTLNEAEYILDENGKAITDTIGRVDETSALVRALPLQLGLALQKKTVPMEVLVIDHVEKNPTAN
jgi:uncharacterized protein (TIGR03435 family)